MITRISSAELCALMRTEEPFALIDVRERNEYERGQIFGATNIARRLLEFRVPALLPEKSVKIVLYSGLEERAILSARLLERNGYTNLSCLEGGLSAWIDSNQPVVSGTHVIGKAFGEIVGEDMDRVHKIKPKELKSWLDRGDDMIIIEVRPLEEVRQTGSIPGAVNIPGVEIAMKITDYLQEGRTIVTTCAGHTRGYIANATLNMMGIGEIYDLECGTLGWRLDGFALEREIKPSPQPSVRSRYAAEALARKLREEKFLQLLSVDEFDELLARTGETTYLIDVRGKDEYELIGHIDGSFPMPGGQAIQNSDDTVAVHRANIVFICDDGTRSALTAYWYNEMGYANVYILQGGLCEWKANGRKTVRGGYKVRLLEWDAAVAGCKFVAPRDIRKQLEDGNDILLIDVNDSRAYSQGHIAGAVRVPRGKLEQRIVQAVPDKHRPLVVSCQDGINAVFAAASLRELGYDRTFCLRGGNKAWGEDGFPLLEGMESGIQDDYFVALSEYDEAEARRYFAWEDRMIHLPEYMDYFRSKGILSVQ